MQGGLEDNKKTLKDNIKELFSKCGASREFFDLRRISVPRDAEDAKNKALTNLEKFKLHYLVMSAMFLFIYVLYCPALVIFIGILAAAVYAYKTRPVFFNIEIEPKSVCVAGGVGVLLFFIFFKEAITGLLAIAAVCSISILTHAVSLEGESEKDEEV